MTFSWYNSDGFSNFKRDKSTREAISGQIEKLLLQHFNYNKSCEKRHQEINPQDKAILTARQSHCLFLKVKGKGDKSHYNP